MRIALIQEERYLPSYHGSNKSSRMLLEELTKLGHSCTALGPIPRDVSPDVLREDLARRGAEVLAADPGRLEYVFRGVRAVGIPSASLDGRQAWLRGRLRDLAPDAVVVSADPRYYLLAAALDACPGRVAFIVHSHEHLPFGPLGRRRCEEQAARLRETSAIVAVSRYSRDYLCEHGGLDATCLPMPVYGEGPPPAMGRPDGGCVTLMNPCVEKGLGLFLELARSFPDRDFAVVRWPIVPGLPEPGSIPNLRFLEPVDDVDAIYSATRVLVMPSIFPETFGLSAVEAMLRGIPVLASDLGGLVEAKLGVDYSLPVRPATVGDGRIVDPGQDVGPWRDALGRLLDDPAEYRRLARASRDAAARFASEVGVRPFEDLFRELASEADRGRRASPPPVGVVDPYDAGFLLAEELIRRGHPCVGIDSDEHVHPTIRLKSRPERLHAVVAHRGDLDATLAQLRRLGVGLVLPGCEPGVPLADQLADALGMRANGAALSESRRDKSLMAEAALRAGLRIPAQVCSGELATLCDWARSEGRWPAVAKPPHSLGSEDVQVCRDEGELEAAARHILGRRNLTGRVNHAVIVQELIFGPQYVVDTVSRDGRHFLSGLWLYGRPEWARGILDSTRGGPWPDALAHTSWHEINYAAVGSNAKQILPGEGEAAATLFDYARRMLDALAIRVGPAHFELMWVDGGPMLVEVGARLHGAPSTHWMSRICTGTSQLDQTIDSYLDPAQFFRTARGSYSLQYHGYKYRLHPWSRGNYRGLRGRDRIERLPSFRGFFYMSDPRPLGVLDCVGVVALIHPDEDVIRQDRETIHNLERLDLFDLDHDRGERP